MLRSFDNETIRLLNKVCAELKPCTFDCFGIGWCDEVYEEVRKIDKDWPSRSAGRCYLMRDGKKFPVELDYGFIGIMPIAVTVGGWRYMLEVPNGE